MSWRTKDPPPWLIVVRISEFCISMQLVFFIGCLFFKAEPALHSMDVVPENWAEGISVFAIFMTDFNSSRIPDLRRYLAQSKIPSEILFEYWFVNYTRENVTALHSVYPPDDYRVAMKLSWRFRRFRKDLDLASKFFFGLRFYEEISSAHWFYRATDDTLIRFHNLLPFMRSLEKRYDPVTEAVVIGNCIDIKRFSYLQGGSGILFSRFAALKLVNGRDEFLKKLNRPEDVFLVSSFEKFGISLYQATSEYFIGHDILAAHRSLLWNGSLNRLPNCPDPSKIWVRSCRPFVAPLKDIVFWHQEGRNKTLEHTIDFANVALSQPRTIMWWLDRGRPTLCRGEAQPRGY
jgi:hypothetical protein